MRSLDYIKKAAAYPSLDPKDFSAEIAATILTDFTDDVLAKLFIGAMLARDIYPSLSRVPYRQYPFALKDPESRLFQAGSAVTFMFFGMNPFKDSALRESHEHFEAILGDIERYAGSQNGTVIVNSCIVSYYGPYGNIPDRNDFFQRAREYNERLAELASRVPRVHIIDTNRIVHRIGEDRTFDLRGLYAFDIPFTQEFMTAIAEEWAAYAQALLGRTRKCIVLDLDNTLWGGVVGELGARGIALGPDYPGNAFVNFQRALLDLSRRGIILAIASKNNPADAIEAFRENPYMVLTEDHFSAMRIDWNDKADNIKAIAEELNIGVDSMVFLDDDPLNRAMVRERLPGIAVPEFSLPPEQYAKALYDLDLFHQLSVTEEDAQRGRMYAEERKRKKAMESAKSVDDYIAELGIEIRTSMNEPSLIPRISQLTLKTNQFNLTTRRYAEHDVERMIGEGGLAISGHVVDKFGDYGTVIAAIVLPDRAPRHAVLDIFLMSCRVMGRGVECTFMDHVLRVLHERGFSHLRAEFIPTLKNKPAEGFLLTHGFSATEHGYILDISAYIAAPCSKVSKTVSITPYHGNP